jgi:hypothetical protein
MKYERHPNFEKQFKKLLKKFRSLEEDLLIAEKAAIELMHVNGIDNNSVELVPGFDLVEVKIYKIKKFACKCLYGKGVRSGVRIVYAFYPAQMRVEYLEIYYKEKENTDMDYNLAKDYCKEFRN